MILSASRQAVLPQPVERRTPGLLLISDGLGRFGSLLSLLRREGVTVQRINKVEDLNGIEPEEYELAIIDLSPSQLQPVLRRLRARAAVEKLSILVEAGRLADNGKMADLLRRFRAMPCALGDLIALARRRLITSKDGRRSKLL